MKKSLKWKPIEDLPNNWRELADGRLKNLADIWLEQKQSLQHSSAVREFYEQLQRKWAVETGLIEGLYTLDRGVTQILVEQGIQASLIPHGGTDQSVSHVVDLIRDQESVVKGLFDFVGGTRTLSGSYIKEIHSALTNHQKTVDAVDGLGRNVQVELIRGDWKKLSNSPTREDGSIHEYCPPEHVAAEMDRLVEWYRQHEQLGAPAEVEAAWFHHRFTQIHPFQDGNGRVARALATLILLKAGWFPLVIVNDQHRSKYIEALEKADAGQLGSLVELFSELEQKAFIKALSISEQMVARKENLDALIDNLADRFTQIEQERRKERRSVLILADNLKAMAYNKMREIKGKLLERLPMFTGSDIWVDESVETTSHYFWDQVVEIANKLEYFANLRKYHSWVRLKLKERRQAEIVVSLHPVGRDFEGLMGASAFLEYRGQEEDGSTRVDGPYFFNSKLFYFSFKEERNNVESLFSNWMDEIIVNGIDEWRRQL